MRFSAALLVKKSAAQLNYISRHNEPALSQIVGTYDGFVKQPTERQIAGNLFADQRTTSPFTEMGGCWSHKNIDIWFAIDEVRVKPRTIQLIEHKYIAEPPAEQWFFEQSLIQTAFLGTLANAKTELRSAAFLKLKEPKLLLLDRPTVSLLNFGGHYYKVKYEPSQVIRFYLTKARVIEDSFFKAKMFDNKYKHQEWDKWFRNHITYRRYYMEQKS